MQHYWMAGTDFLYGLPSKLHLPLSDLIFFEKLFCCTIYSVLSSSQEVLKRKTLDTSMWKSKSSKIFKVFFKIRCNITHLWTIDKSWFWWNFYGKTKLKVFFKCHVCSDAKRCGSKKYIVLLHGGNREFPEGLGVREKNKITRFVMGMDMFWDHTKLI